MLDQNVNMKGSMREGGVRGGASVFAGILLCGACGRKVLVSGQRVRSHTTPSITRMARLPPLSCR